MLSSPSEKYFKQISFSEWGIWLMSSSAVEHVTNFFSTLFFFFTDSHVKISMTQCENVWRALDQTNDQSASLLKQHEKFFFWDTKMCFQFVSSTKSLAQYSNLSSVVCGSSGMLIFSRLSFIWGSKPINS